MPILLYCAGGLAVAIGAAMIGFGIPNNAFGIGNTLIVAGTTAVTGGLIVGALGVAVAQLQRLVETLATRAPVRSSRPFDTFDPAAAARPPARVQFPPKTKPELTTPEFRPEPPAEIGQRDAIPQPAMREPAPREPSLREPLPREPLPREPQVETAQDFDEPRFAAPTLSNPDEPPVTAADEAYLSPLHPVAPPPFSDRETQPPAPRKASTYFDAMWPAEPKPAEPESEEPRVSEFQWSDVRRGEPGPADTPAAKPPLADDDSEPVAENDLPAQGDDTDESEAPRNVAILKSGVVDGMGYTLYVDGSIEAELPQGTLRFASINELRSHLEKTS